MSKYVIYDPMVCTKTDLKSHNVPDGHYCSLNKIIDPPDEECIRITPGNDYLCVGEKVYNYVAKHYHLGLRKVTYRQVCDLPKVSTSDGINFSFVAKVTGTTKFVPKLKNFLDKNFNRRLKLLPEENRLITTDLKVGIEWMRNWLDGKWHEKDPWDGWFGLDYETADVTNLGHKDICGVGIASISRGIFIDFRHPRSKEEWDEFSATYKEFCLRYRDRLFAYNSKFEFDRTDETFQFYVDFMDAGVMNIVDGRQKIYYSLKFTAQYYNSVSSWDDDFDLFAEYLHNKIFKNYANVDQLLADSEYLPRCKKHFIDDEDFDEWVELCKSKPDYWGDRFYLQTSRNLGRYCILDSYHTLMIAVTQWNKYPELANILTADNLRLGQQLMATGCFLDVDKRTKLRKINQKFMCYCLFKLSSAMATLKQIPVRDGFLKDLSPYSAKLAKKGIDISSSRFWDKVSSLIIDEESESFLNEYNSEEYLGHEVTQKLIGFHAKKGRPYTKCSKSKSNKETLDRYKSMIMSPKDYEILRAHKSEFDVMAKNKVYQDRLEMMQESELWNMSFDEVDPEGEYFFNGKKRTLEQIVRIMNAGKGNPNGWYKWGSPTPQKEARSFFMNIMKGYPCAFTFNMYNRTKYMKLIYGEELLNKPRDLYPIFCADMKSYVSNICRKIEDGEITKSDYKPSEDSVFYRLQTPTNIDKVYRHLDDFLKGKYEYSMKTENVFNDGHYDRLRVGVHNGFGRWDRNGDYVNIRTRANKFGFTYDPETPYEIITTCIKCIYMFSIYNKEMQYIDGVFSTGVHKVDIIDKDLRVKRNKDGKYDHIDTAFKMCRLKTKRNSSGFHTIPHATCIKGIVKAPEGYAMSYFDVSQAEPRTCAYLIEQDKMKECYETGQDLYYLTAAIMHGQTYDEFRARPDAKSFRSAFKTVLLGLLYGMGADTLGGRIGADTETAKEYIKALFNAFPKLKPLIEEFKQYPKSHDRQCKTFWGDRLVSEPCDDGALMRHGINYPVQGNTSIALTAGFYNVVRQCEDAGLNIRPVLAIHDALVCYFPIDQLWDLNQFYTHNFTDYLYKMCGVKYKFSVNYGTDYYNMAEITNIDEDNIKIEGNNQTILQLMERLDSVGFKYEVVESKSEIVPVTKCDLSKYNGQVGEGAVYDEDTSFNKVILRRLSKSTYKVPIYDKENL